MSDDSKDVIDHLVGVIPGSALDAVRHGRPTARDNAQKSYEALFAPVDAGTVLLEERFAIAYFVAALHKDEAVSAFYREQLGHHDRNGLIGAISAYEQGLARPEEIDLAMKLGCGHPMGPLALSDLIGLDIVYAMAKLLQADFQDARFTPPSLLRRLVQDGQLGKKAGVGFYDYRASGEPRANEEILELVRAGMFARAGATVGHAA